MPDVKQVIAILSNRSAHDAGRVTVGYYVVDGGVLTMVDGKGNPFRGRGGDKMVHKLQADEDPGIIAQRLTMKIFTTLHGDRLGGFNRPIHYPVTGIA